VRPEAVTVVVPTYDERANIERLVEAVRAHGYRILVVDDGSPDGTGALVDGIAASDPLVEVLHRPHKAGLGRAYGAAFRQALDQGADVVVEMDADFSHDPGDLPRLIEAVEGGADLAIGSRYVTGGGTPDWPLGRRLISRGGNVYVRALLGIPIRDATAGFRAFRREALERLPFATARASGYGFQVEMAYAAARQGLEVVEVPIQFTDRRLGESKMNSRIVAEAMWLVTVWGVRRLVPGLPSHQP
jgi:dolichol-phosphate mannosyltransferase